MSRRDIAVLRDRLHDALRTDRLEEAFSIYEVLEKAEPAEPRWPHRRGDLLIRMERMDDAIAAFEQAVDLYAEQGFLPRAVALAKMILGFDPKRSDVLARLTNDAARELHRRHRSVAKVPDLRTGRPSLLDATSFPTLTPAEDAHEDEVRFKDCKSIELDLTELDFVDRTSFPEIVVEAVASDEIDLDEEAPASSPTAEQLAKLPAFPVFAELPAAAFSHLAERAELVEVDDGDVIVKNGAPADSLYAIVEGRVRVLVPGIPEDAAVVLAEGDVFGESCLLEGATRKADVVAKGRLVALRIAEDDLEAMIEQHPPVGEVVFDLLTRRVVGNLMFTSPLFAGFDHRSRAEIAKLFEARKAEEGQLILESGKRSDGLYVLLAGTLELSDGDSAELLEPVTMFGQASLLSRDASSHSVRAVSEALVLRLPAARFLELAALYPTVLAQLAELASQPAVVQLA